jgi:hypothetical protein
MGWTRLDALTAEATGESQWLAQEIALLFEVLGMLAFGRDIVVPSAYAFDSIPFLAVAPIVWAARDDAAAQVRSRGADVPFRVNLAEGQRFEEEVASRVRKADGGPTFVSSAFPELHELSAEQRGRYASDLPTLSDLTHVDIDRAGAGLFNRGIALREVVQELGGARARTDRPHGPTLNQLLNVFRQVAPDLRREVTARNRIETLELLAAKVDELLALVPDLNSRTPFHGSEPWDAIGGRTIEEFAGGHVPLRQLREFVDTLYNFVLLRSTTARAATFTTELSDDIDAAARAFAQDVAVASGMRDVGGTAEGSGDDGEPIGFSVSAPRALAAGRKESLQRVRDRLIRALGLVMQDRADPTSPFWTKVAEIDQASLDGGDALRKAVDRHIEHVAHRLGTFVHVETKLDRRVEFSATTLQTGGETTSLVATWTQLPLVATGPILTAAVLAPALLRRGGRAVRRHQERSWWRENFADAVTIGDTR